MSRARLPIAAVGLVVVGCASAPPAAEEAVGESEPVLLGPLSRERIEAAAPDWVAAEVEARPDADAALRLAGVGDGARVTVYLGTWCEDSRRELARLWRALDEAGGEVPFALDYVGVDRDKRRPAEGLAGVGLRYVPTFVVRRAERELGRIVESSPGGIEADLAALLSGELSGVISARDDLGAEPEGGAS